MFWENNSCIVFKVVTWKLKTIFGQHYIFESVATHFQNEYILNGIKRNALPAEWFLLAAEAIHSVLQRFYDYLYSSKFPWDKRVAFKQLILPKCRLCVSTLDVLYGQFKNKSLRLLVLKWVLLKLTASFSQLQTRVLIKYSKSQSIGLSLKNIWKNVIKYGNSADLNIFPVKENITINIIMPLFIPDQKK